MAMAGDPDAMLHACGLPQAWVGLPAFRVLDTQFGQGERFLRTWQAWRQDSARPGLLHYVALCQQPPTADALLAEATDTAHLPLAQPLADQWFGLLPGFHRLSLDDGRVLLTLCVGDVHAALRAQAFHADALFLHGQPGWPVGHFKALARCCRRGTRLAVANLNDSTQRHLVSCGFLLGEGTGGVLQGRYDPPWQFKTTHRDTLPAPFTRGDCTVVGAGLAGASVAAALARRGFQVLVLDAAPHPAAQASGLPAGLMAPLTSADDGARSQLVRAGLRLSLQQAQACLRRGQDWDASGVLERRLDGYAGLAEDWPAAGQAWSRAWQADATQEALWQAPLAGTPALWHPVGAWVKPASLVTAWLASEGVYFQGNATVARISHTGGSWCATDAQGQVLAESPHMVLAAAWATPALLANAQAAPSAPLQTTLHSLGKVHGQVSWARHPVGGQAPLPPFPVNGHGSFIPGVPQGGGQAWYAGATFEPGETALLSLSAAHQANLDKLSRLLPAGAPLLRDAIADGSVQAWRNIRCTSPDRLPVVGRLDAGGPGTSLWVSTALGSRGLSYSVLCAQLLAAQMCGEPWPVPASLARLLAPARRTAKPAAGAVPPEPPETA
jgi:tRNA 5-methylaminomethyl-2-thiouridine biosynthesis bifunctional protein